ncbi:MAG: ornithine carbamoyltransferase [Rhodospirillales bacterium]|nr:ornithine carbamoyltransferase [Rhodospirillales bacterium]
MSTLKTTPKHFLNIDQFDTATLRAILSHASELKKAGRGHAKPLTGHTLVLIFEKSSTRTRVSFEVGMQQLGGNVVVLGSQDSQLGRGESVADTARVLSRFADAIMIRTDSHQKLEWLAEYASVPVINGLTDDSHPNQIMADVMTFEEHRGPIEGKTIAWVGDGNNVAASWLHAAVKFNFKFNIATPQEFRLPDHLIEWANSEDGDITITNIAENAVADADCVVADTWISMGDDDERDKRLELLSPYQVNDALMAGAKSEALFMHCLPAHRGEEVTDTVIDGKQSVVWDEAENRLHAQKGILAYCLDVL